MNRCAAIAIALAVLLGPSSDAQSVNCPGAAPRSTMADWTSASFRGEGDLLYMSGGLDESTPGAFDAALKCWPNVKTIVMEWVPGSDGIDYFDLAQTVRAKGLNTRVPQSGLVASGGADFFLAGNKRTIELGACAGVHAWGAGCRRHATPATPRHPGDRRCLDAATLPRSDPLHQEYLDFFPKIGISNDFYWFTLEAATFDDMYYMTKADMQKYSFATDFEGSGDTDQLRCENLDKIKITHGDPAHVHPIAVDHDHTKDKEESSSFVVSSGSALQAGTAAVAALLVCVVTLVAK